MCRPVRLSEFRGLACFANLLASICEINEPDRSERPVRLSEFLGLARSANLSASKNCGHRKAILARTRGAVSSAHKFFPGVKKKETVSTVTSTTQRWLEQTGPQEWKVALWACWLNRQEKESAQRMDSRRRQSTFGAGTLLSRFRVKFIKLCGGKSGAGRCDCRGGGGCGWCCWRWYTAKI